MEMIVMTVREIDRRGRWMISTEAHGDLLDKSSLSPFTAGARALSALGVPDETPIGMKHEGESVGLTSTVGRARLLIAHDPDKGKVHISKYREWSGIDENDGEFGMAAA